MQENMERISSFGDKIVNTLVEKFLCGYNTDNILYYNKLKVLVTVFI